MCIATGINVGFHWLLFNLLNKMKYHLFTKTVSSYYFNFSKYFENIVIQ